MRIASMSHLRRLPRYREVANILVKNGFGFVFYSFGIRHPWLLRYRHKEDLLAGDSLPRRLRLACEEAGPTFVKLGQLLSTRADLLSPEYIRELERLQDNVPPVPFAEVEAVLMQEGLELSTVFLEFDQVPIAAGSIGQVHQAILSDGERVIVKVKRPNIDHQVATDLAIIMDLALYAEKHHHWARHYRVSELIEELAHALHNELDFRKEARNADRFLQHFAHNPHVIIPRIFWQYSSEHILVMQYVPGIKISDTVGIKASGYRIDRIVEHLVECLFQQIYLDGFFHADPHPGNIAVGEGEAIVLYDFGQVGFVDQLTRDKYMDLVIGMMRYDTEAVTRALMRIAIDDQYVQISDLRRDIGRLAQKYYRIPLSRINMGESLREILGLAMKHRLRMPAELTLMAKMLLTLESLVAHLDPGMSLVDIAEPYGKRALKERYSARRLGHEARGIMIEYADIARTLPRGISNLVKRVEEGELQIKMEYSNLKDMLMRIDIMSNRICLAIVMSSILIGCSLIVDQAETHLLRHFPLVEAGFVVAFLIGLYLAYSILRSGRY
ncbi:MAG: ABC1 kinase family protein [Syntrophomonadaceae bacterium]